MVLVIIIAVYVGSIGLVMRAPKERSRNPARWGALAVFTGILALFPLVILGTSKKGYRRSEEEEEEERELERARIEEDEEARVRARARVLAEGGTPSDSTP